MRNYSRKQTCSSPFARRIFSYGIQPVLSPVPVQLVEHNFSSAMSHSVSSFLESQSNSVETTSKDPFLSESGSGDHDADDADSSIEILRDAETSMIHLPVQVNFAEKGFVQENEIQLQRLEDYSQYPGHKDQPDFCSTVLCGKTDSLPENFGQVLDLSSITFNSNLGDIFTNSTENNVDTHTNVKSDQTFQEGTTTTEPSLPELELSSLMKNKILCETSYSTDHSRYDENSHYVKEKTKQSIDNFSNINPVKTSTPVSRSQSNTGAIKANDMQLFNNDLSAIGLDKLSNLTELTQKPVMKPTSETTSTPVASLQLKSSDLFKVIPLYNNSLSPIVLEKTETIMPDLALPLAQTVQPIQESTVDLHVKPQLEQSKADCIEKCLKQKGLLTSIGSVSEEGEDSLTLSLKAKKSRKKKRKSELLEPPWSYKKRKTKPMARKYSEAETSKSVRNPENKKNLQESIMHKKENKGVDSTNIHQSSGNELLVPKTRRKKAREKTRRSFNTMINQGITNKTFLKKQVVSTICTSENSIQNLLEKTPPGKMSSPKLVPSKGIHFQRNLHRPCKAPCSTSLFNSERKTVYNSSESLKCAKGNSGFKLSHIQIEDKETELTQKSAQKPKSGSTSTPVASLELKNSDSSKVIHLYNNGLSPIVLKNLQTIMPDLALPLAQRVQPIQKCTIGLHVNPQVEKSKTDCLEKSQKQKSPSTSIVSVSEEGEDSLTLSLKAKKSRKKRRKSELLDPWSYKKRKAKQMGRKYSEAETNKSVRNPENTKNLQESVEHKKDNPSNVQICDIICLRKPSFKSFKVETFHKPLCFYLNYSDYPLDVLIS